MEIEGNLPSGIKRATRSSPAMIAEIETDKATMEFELSMKARSARSQVPEGAQGIKVNQPIAVLLEEGEEENIVTARPAPRRQNRQQRRPERPHLLPREARSAGSSGRTRAASR